MFNNKGSFVWRLIGILLLIGLMVGGGVMAYRAGVAQGIAQAPEVATAIGNAAENAYRVPMSFNYPHNYPSYKMHPRGFFPFGGIVGLLLFSFIFFGLMRMIFRPWGWHYGHMHGRGPWKGSGRHWGGPPWAYEDKEDDNKADSEKEEDK